MKSISSVLVIFLCSVIYGSCQDTRSGNLEDSKIVAALRDPNEVMVNDQFPGGAVLPGQAYPYPYQANAGLQQIPGQQLGFPGFPNIGGPAPGFSGFPSSYPPYPSPCGGGCGGTSYPIPCGGGCGGGLNINPIWPPIQPYNPCGSPCQSSGSFGSFGYK